MRQKGVTLVELLIVVAIIGILAAIAIPSYIRWVRKAKMTANIEKCRRGGLRVELTDSAIIVINISLDPLAIRISWDGKDPDGIGVGEDPFIDNWVEFGESVQREYQEHNSSQIWAWDESTELVAFCDLPLNLSPH